MPSVVKEPTPRRIWFFCFLLALLLHLAGALTPWNQILSHSFAPIMPPRLALDSVSPEQLDKIRKQWQEKKLLISKESTKPDDLISKPEDARFLSDRNRDVKKETRAERTNILPTPKRVPKIGDLGVPLKLTEALKRKTIIASSQDLEDQGDQMIDEDALPIGAENTLKTQQYVYYSYYSRLYEQIGPIWQSLIRSVSGRKRIVQGDYITQVEVVFDRSGALLRIHYLNSSGIPEFDNAVERSWKKIERFPNPPQGLLDSDGHIRTGWTFTVHVGPNFNMLYLPPKRNY